LCGIWDITGTKMDHCSVDGEGAQYGSIGCQIGGGEVVPFLAVDCQFNELGAAWVTGSIQSVLVVPVVESATTLPIQNALLFPASGTISIGSTTTATYTGKDHSNRSISDGGPERHHNAHQH
jgi:hypothetical protein